LMAAVCSGGSAADDEGPQSASPALPQWPSGTAGPQSVQSAPAESASQPKPKELTPEEAARDRALRERIQQRWDAVIGRDFAKAYAFETPDYRKTHTAEQYAGQFGSLVKWFMASVKEVKYDRADEAEVVVALDVILTLAGGDTARTTVNLNEQWVYLDGQWWRRDDHKRLGSSGPSEPSPPQ